MLTPKERSKIYRKAAEINFIERHYTSCCIAICDYEANGEYYNLSNEEFAELFPELFLFKNQNAESFWWKSNETEPRILALLFASEIALDSSREK